MSRSSSSSLGSSLMPLNSLRAVGAHRMRMVDGAVDHLRASTLMLIDTGAVALHGEQVVVDGRVHALRGLGGADRPAEVAHAPPSAQELEAAAKMLDARARVRGRGVLDHERGHHVARLVGRQLGEEGRGRSRRKPLQRLDDFPQASLAPYPIRIPPPKSRAMTAASLSKVLVSQPKPWGTVDSPASSRQIRLPPRTPATNHHFQSSSPTRPVARSSTLE